MHQQRGFARQLWCANPLAVGDRKMPEALSEIGFYYPGHVWQRGDWIKTLLLFFDGTSVLLVPEYKQEEPERFDPVIAGPLRDEGLLHYLRCRRGCR